MTGAIVVSLIALGKMILGNISSIILVAMILKKNPDKFHLTWNKSELTEISFNSKAGEQ